MTLVELLVLKFAEPECQHDYNDWPEDVVACREYNSEVTFEGWKYTYTSPYGNNSWEQNVGFEVDGELPYMDSEYDDSETVTRDEYFEFITKRPNFVQEIADKRRANMSRIAELNKIAYGAVDEAIKLSHEAGLPYTCSMPSSVADLDENSDWASSRC
jgi:hypothetical protein